MVQNSFFEYKMSLGDSITTHVNKVVSMGNLLKDLGQPVQEDMVIAKMIFSLPPSYNNIIAIWTNVPALEQTIANLKIRLQMENPLNLQAGDNQVGGSVFFMRSSKPSSKSKKSRCGKDRGYIQELKSKT